MANIFRKSAIERLSSPDQLDSLITITSPSKWIALLTVGLMLALAIVWGVFGRIPVKVDTSGILISSGGVTSIPSTVTGQISDINVEVGDHLKKGDIIAIIEETEMIKQINKNQDLINSLESLSGTSDWNSITVPTQLSELQQLGMQIQTQKSTLETAGIDVEYARKEYNAYTKLYNKKAITKEELDVKKVAYEKTQAVYQQQQLAVEQAQGQFDSVKEAKLDDLKNANQDSRNTINSEYRIVAPSDGKVVSISVETGSVIGAGTSIASVANTGDQVKALEGVIYVPVSDGKKLQEGMEVKLYPSTVQKEEYGYMVGTVISVPEYPVNGQTIMTTLGNEALVQQLSGKGAPLEVHVDLVADESTVSGYQWSSKKGATVNVENGTICTASVVVAQQSPISMVIPILKQKYLPFE